MEWHPVVLPICEAPLPSTVLNASPAAAHIYVPVPANRQTGNLNLSMRHACANLIHGMSCQSGFKGMAMRMRG